MHTKHATPPLCTILLLVRETARQKVRNELRGVLVLAQDLVPRGMRAAAFGFFGRHGIDVPAER